MRDFTHICVAAGMLAVGLGSMALGAAPTTQPKAGKVVVLPFAQTNPGAPQTWVGQAIRQGMLADLTAHAPGRVQALDEHADDDKSVIGAAHKAGAAYVVTGSIVTAGRTIRVEGRVLDVESGNPVSSMQATGPADNLLPLQTALADQLGRAIGLDMPAAPAPAVSTANPWGTNNDLSANPYAPAMAGTAVSTGVSDFGPYGYGGFPYGPYLGPGYVTPAVSHHHNHGFGSYGQIPPGSLGVPSIAGGGGVPPLDGGMPYGIFIPTTRAQAQAFNRYGGLGTVDITRPAGPSAPAHHGTGAGHK